MNITAAALTERISPALAVDRALTGEQRSIMLEQVLTGPMSGAQPVDWIEMASDASAYLPIVDPWLEARGAKCRDVLAAKHELPVQLARRLYVAALYACIATGDADPARPGAVYALAERAGLWARGYAEALGWVFTRDVPWRAATEREN
jgi:hypothetical protein